MGLITPKNAEHFRMGILYIISIILTIPVLWILGVLRLPIFHIHRFPI